MDFYAVLDQVLDLLRQRGRVTYVEGFVQVTALGPVPVKGLEEPIEVFELMGTSGLRRRLQVAVARGLTPFVGRQQELEAIHQALAQAQDGHGQVVVLMGEAGVGKSRLVHEVVHSHRSQDWLAVPGRSHAGAGGLKPRSRARGMQRAAENKATYRLDITRFLEGSLN